MSDQVWTVVIMMLAGATGGGISSIMTKREFPAQPNTGRIPAFFTRNQGTALIVIGLFAGLLTPLILAFVAAGIGMENVAERLFIGNYCGDYATLLGLYQQEMTDGSYDAKKFIETIRESSLSGEGSSDCAQNQLFYDQLKLWGLAFLAGFLAWNVIPNLANRIDNRLSALKRMEAEARPVHEAIVSMDEGRDE